LAGSLFVCAGGCSWFDAGNAANDRYRQLIQRRNFHVEEKGDCQAAELNSELWSDGCALHGQDRTITEGKIVLEKHLDVKGNTSERVLNYGYMNSYYQTG